MFTIGTGRPTLGGGHRLEAALALAAFLTAFCCDPRAGLGQAAGVNQGGPPSVHASPGLDPLPQHGTSEAARKVDQMREAERSRRVAADTAKLVELSNQLKAEVDGTPHDQLSLSALRKAAEIEKIAHDLKGWLKAS